METTESAQTQGPSSHPQAAPLEFRSVSKRYPGSERPAIQDLSLEIPAGEICCIVGPSGGGKTTAMKMVNRLIDITEGDILIAGQSVRQMDVTELRRGIGYVIQQIGLFPHMTVTDNVSTVPRLLGWDRGRIRTRAAELLDLVGLEPELGRRYPAQLSGGQRQRVGLARALAVDPPLMLMDEPFGAIDPITRERLQDEFLRLQERIRKTVLFVTHDIDEAIKMGDRIIILREGGILAQYDTPQEILAHPADDFVARFVGADRGLKRLSLSDLSDLRLLEPAPNGESHLVGTPADAPRADLGTSLRDALSLMLTSGSELVVVDGEGKVAGRATIELIQAALRNGRGSAGEEGGVQVGGERGTA